MYFTVRKLNRMSFRLRSDKVASVLKALERDISDGKGINSNYITDICLTLTPEMGRESADLLFRELEILSSNPLYAVNNIRHLILSEIGRDPAEWDLSSYADSRELSGRKVLDINVYLDNIRSPFNVGSVFRTAESFCFKKIFLSPLTPSPELKRARRSAMGTSDIVEWGRGGIEDLPGPVFALELGGTDAGSFKFPDCGTVIIGSEELGVSPDSVKAAKKGGGIVTIPLYGCKSSINVGVAFGILAYSWIAFLNKKNLSAGGA